MANYNKLIVFLSLFFFSCLSAEADRLDDLGIRNNDPKMIGKIVSVKWRNVERNRVEFAFEVILKNLEETPKKIILAYTKNITGLAPRIGLYAYIGDDWVPIDNGAGPHTNSLVVPGKSQKILKFEAYVPNDGIKYLNLPLKLVIGGYKMSPTDWGKSIEIDFRIKPQDVPKIMGQ